MESVRKAIHFEVHIFTHAHNLVCMHASLLHEWAYIFTQSGKKSGKQVSIKSWRYAFNFLEHFLTPADKLACMHSYSCVLGPISMLN